MYIHIHFSLLKYIIYYVDVIFNTVYIMYMLYVTHVLSHTVYIIYNIIYYMLSVIFTNIYCLTYIHTFITISLFY